MVQENFESALDYCKKGKLQENSKVAFLEDIKEYSFVVLRFRPKEEIFTQKLGDIGLNLPDSLRFTGDLSKKNSPLLLWISPDEYLLIIRTEEKDTILSKLQPICDDHNAFLVDNSGTYSFFRLGGEKIKDILKKSTPYNIETLDVGKVVSTNLGQSVAVFFKTEQNIYNILARFSFSAYAYELLETHAEEYLAS